MDWVLKYEELSHSHTFSFLLKSIRNKAQFPVGRGKNGELLIGFYAGRTHTIMNTEHCYLQAKRFLSF